MSAARSLFLASAALVSVTGVLTQRFKEHHVAYKWKVIDYDWESAPMSRQEYIDEKKFIPENNVITGIKTYNGTVYVTVPRWRKGVPSTLNKVVMKNGKPVLQPYPSWEWQKEKDCDYFQFTQSMEIDPATGLMWIIDTGRLYTWDADTQNPCPPRLRAWNMEKNKIEVNYKFGRDVVNWNKNFLNDLVVDSINEFVYISDVGDGPNGHKGGIVVYNMKKVSAHRLEHSSMHPDPNNQNITINGKVYPSPVAVDGIALSPDRSQLFYCPLGGLNLYQIPTPVASESGSTDLGQYIRNLGAKKSQTDGMIMGRKRLYYGALSLNAVYAWEYETDMRYGTLDKIPMDTVRPLLHDDDNMVWPDTFALENGWLWVTAVRLPLFRNNELDYSEDNFRIIRIYVDDTSYIERIVSGAENKSSFGLLFMITSNLLIGFTWFF